LPEDKLKTPIIVIGAGGIGSMLVLLLAKMGFENITVYDPDTIEDHNIPNQMLPYWSKYDNETCKTYKTVGGEKVWALGELARHITGEDHYTGISTRYDGKLAPIIISGVDSMESRSGIWQSIRMQTECKLYIDARMGSETCAVYTIKPYAIDDINFYEKTLYSDVEASQESCTAKAIIYNTAFIGSIIASRVKNYLVGVKNKREIIAEITTLDILTRD